MSPIARAMCSVFSGLVVLACGLPDSAAQSPAKSTEAYPSRPIRVIVPFPPGASPNDVTARMLGPKLADALGQQVVVDNRPGAAGTIGSDLVAKAPPDGYTLLVNSSSLTIAPNAYRSLPFDPAKDLQPIAMVASAPMLVMVGAAVPVATIKELIAYAKSKPGEIKFSSGGNGTVPHLAGEMMNHMAGIRMSHIPYKGGAPAAAALLGGEVSMYIDTPTGSLAMIKQGRVKVLGVASPKRTSLLPDVPTVAEAGLPGYEMSVWYGYFAPARTPDSVVRALHGELGKALQSPDIQSRFTNIGTETVSMSTEEFTRVFRADLQKWSKFVRDTGLKLD